MTEIISSTSNNVNAAHTTNAQVPTLPNQPLQTSLLNSPQHSSVSKENGSSHSSISITMIEGSKRKPYFDMPDLPEVHTKKRTTQIKSPDGLTTTTTKTTMSSVSFKPGYLQKKSYVFNPDPTNDPNSLGSRAKMEKVEEPLCEKRVVEKMYRSRNVAHWMECSKEKTPMPLLTLSLDAALVEEAMDALQEGSTLYKVKSFSSWYRRRYVFEKENKRIVYQGSSKIPCLKTTEIIDIGDIHDIRKGWKTDRFNKIAFKVAREKQKRPARQAMMDENCCFSVIHGPDHVTLDLVCPDETICNKWVRGLSHLIALQRSIERDQAYNSWLQEQFRKADMDNSGGLNFEECMNLLRQLNIEMSKEHTKNIFDEANTNKIKRNDEDIIDDQEFLKFYMLLKKRPELENLFNKYSAGSNVWGPNNLLAFLENEQNMKHLQFEDAADIIDIYEPTVNKDDGFLTLDGFRKLMQSDLMDIFNVNHRVVYQDMKQPMSHYFIASSHNTYLLADQITGESSVEGYITAFKMGCRCVELDLWDGPDNEPIVYHGYTLTTKILLKDIIQDAIKPYAFLRSEYPVILSLENHLSVDQQVVAANHFKTILGDLLYTNDISPNIFVLPSPFYLKKKILIKGKKLTDNFLDVSRNEEEDSVSDEETKSEIEVKAKRVKLAQELSDLVNICKAVHFESFEKSRKEGNVCRISSFSEGKGLRLASDSPEDFIVYNERLLTRIYPSGTRQGSSNYDPIPYWNVGCQLVSLNYQTKDDPMMLNEAKFEDNGRCGYILKPQFLRTNDLDAVDSTLNLDGKEKTSVIIEIISGQCIPKPRQASWGEIIDPYVVMSVLGHPEDQVQLKTKYVHNNGFNPIWDEVFTVELAFPELAFFHFLVLDYSVIGKDEKLGEFCLPFSCLQPGYRHVHLRDEYNRPMIPASIYVHVTIL